MIRAGGRRLATRIQSYLSVRDAIVVCLSLLLVVVGGAVVRQASGAAAENTDTWKIGGDFVEFYMAGRILNEGQGSRLYDMELQKQIFCELMPGETSLRLPFLYPPFVALPFRLFALLPQPLALGLFLFVLPAILVAAVWCLIAQFGPADREQRMFAVVAALSFSPFILYSWLGAQISVIGLAAVALAMREEGRGRPFWSGAALSVCVYKPTLLVLVLPMLILSGRWRQLTGFVAGGLVLGLVSVMTAGFGAMAAFAERMIWMSRSSTRDSGLFNAHRYVDLSSFARLLSGDGSPIATVGFAAMAALIAAALIYTWVRFRRASPTESLLVWAATITWTLTLNIYTPLYDCTLVVAAAIVAAAAIRQAHGTFAHGGFILMLALLYTTPLVAEVVARALHIQPFTLVLSAFGTWLLFELHALRRAHSAASHAAYSAAAI